MLERTVAASGVLPRRDLAERAALDNLALAACRLGRDELIEPLYEALAPYRETFGHSVVAHHCGHHYLGHLAAAAGWTDQAGAHFRRPPGCTGARACRCCWPSPCSTGRSWSRARA